MFNVGYYILNLAIIIDTLWIVKKYLNNFFEMKKMNILSITTWFLFFTFQVFIKFYRRTVSIWTTIISILLVLAISISNYEKRGKVKLFIVVLLYTIWSIVEMLVFFCMCYVPIELKEVDLMGDIISKIFMMIGIYLFSILIARKDNEFIPAKYYFVLLFIPIGSIYIAVNEFYLGISYTHTILPMITFSILLIFNLIIFELYFKIAENFIYEKEKTLYVQQIDIVSRSTKEQKEMMENFYEEKHNLVNELVALKNSVENSNQSSVIENINRIINVCDINEKISNCGNNIVDALINFKYAVAKVQGIKFNLKIFVPDLLPINQCDIGIVLGNSIDNAIEAVKECKHSEKLICITMGVKKESLVLVVKNPYENCIKKDKKGNLLTTKKEVYRHGYGINSIKRVVEKYEGEVLIVLENNHFIITIIMNLGKFLHKIP